MPLGTVTIELVLVTDSYFFFVTRAEHKINSLYFFMHKANSIYPLFFHLNFLLLLLVRVQLHLVDRETLSLYAGNMCIYSIGLFLGGKE